MRKSRNYRFFICGVPIVPIKDMYLFFLSPKPIYCYLKASIAYQRTYTLEAFSNSNNGKIF